MSIIITVTLFFGLVYAIFAVILGLTLRFIHSGVSNAKPKVTIIIPARNERATLGACLASVLYQDYGDDLYEVIVADDRSQDGTLEVLTRFEEIADRLNIIRIDVTPEGLSSKKHALSELIKHARGDIIIQTDADCIVPVTWISGMVRGFEDGVGMVTGIAPYSLGTGYLNSFVCHEYLWNAVLSSGSIALGKGTHASGRNLAFRRDVYERCGGYGAGKTIVSGDDTLFLQRVRKLSGMRVRTTADPSTHVYTDSPRTFPVFFRQRTRHMSTGKYFDVSHMLIGAAAYGFHIILCLMLPLSLLSTNYFIVFAALFSGKCIVDSFVGLQSEKALGLNVQWRRFLLNEFFLTLYMAIMPLAGLIIPVKWKEKS